MKITYGKQAAIFLLVVAFAIIGSHPVRSQVAVRKAAKDLMISRAYFLGVKLGQSSVHAMVSHYMAAGPCLAALESARNISRDLLSVIPDLIITRYDRPIHICTSEGRNASDMQRHWDAYRASLVNDIVNLRNHAGSLLERKNRRWYFSFKLGEAMGIAEGQATVGEPARAIVRDALVQANRFAAALNLDTVAVTYIIRDIDSGHPITSIYPRVMAVQGKYNNSLR